MILWVSEKVVYRLIYIVWYEESDFHVRFAWKALNSEFLPCRSGQKHQKCPDPPKTCRFFDHGVRFTRDDEANATVTLKNANSPISETHRFYYIFFHLSPPIFLCVFTFFPL